MRLFQDASIKKKVNLISLLTTGIALLIASGVLIMYELFTFRRSLIDNLTVQAKMIGNNSTAALTFNDRKVAEEILSALNVAPNIICATIYSKDGKVFANYQRPGVKRGFIVPTPQQDGYHYGMDHVSLFQHILLDDETVGTIHIRSDLKEFYFHSMGFSAILMMAMGISLFIAFLVWSKLHLRITKPIFDLAQMMQMISKGKDYSARAVIYSKDETGSLAQGFNEMLAQIQKRDIELEHHRQHLEDQVTRRTAELKRANEQLQQELLERRRVEEALGESEEGYRRFVENLPIGVTRTTPGPQGRFLIANQAYLGMFGFDSEEDLKKMSAADLYMDPNQRKAISDTLMAHGSISGLDLQLKKKDGTIWWGSFTGRAVYNEDGEDVLFDCTLEDITKRKRAEKEKAALEEQLLQSQKMEAIGRLAGGIAHDFNNLLTVISGNCELSLYELRKGDPARLQIEEIKKAADRAATLTRQLLAFSRHQILEVKVQSLNTLLHDLEKMLHRVIGEDIELVTVLSEEVGRVKVDPGQIEQVIINLVVNARDAMPSGGRLTLETADAELDEEYAHSHVGVLAGRYVMLSVSDTGVGMTPEVRERIFEPFFTTKEKGKGTGLGLSTVYGIVKQSGGHIWVYSEPGQGTSFKIYLPRVEEPLEEVKERGVAEELPRGEETVLVVEDEEEVRKLAVGILRRQGYRVLDSSQGGEALLICEQYRESIHLMVTDVVMPRMSGRELAERLSTIHPEMKVLYMSGYTDNAIVHHGVLRQGVEYIQKPFTVDGLARKVRKILDKPGR